MGGTATPAARKTEPQVHWTSLRQQEPLAVLPDFHHLQPVQVLDHVGPLEDVTVIGQPGL